MCDVCGGSGVCPPCDGHGYTADLDPNTDEHADCELCFGDGRCVGCTGTGEHHDEFISTNRSDHEVSSGVMT